MFKPEYFDDDCEIFGCAYECPFQKRSQDCPLAEIDQLKFNEKVVWVNDLTKGKKELIIEHHLICIRAREQKKK